SGEAVFGIPLSENTSFSTAIGIYRNKITTSDGTTPLSVSQYLVDTLGDRARFTSYYFDTDGDPLTPPVLVPGPNRQWVVNAWTLKGGYTVDTRNNFLFPTRGTLHSISAEVALPGSDLTYYRLAYDF